MVYILSTKPIASVALWMIPAYPAALTLPKSATSLWCDRSTTSGLIATGCNLRRRFMQLGSNNFSITVARRGTGHTLRPESLVAAARFPGYGRGWQGRHHQARYVRSKSSGLPGIFLQATLVGGPRPRLFLALRQVLARAGTDRDLQPIVL